MMKKNTLASSVHGNGQLYLHFAPKGPWSQRLHKGAQDIWRESNNKLSMTWNADSQWCQRAGGSHGSHLAEGRPLWNDDARFGEDLERRFKKKQDQGNILLLFSREVCVGHLEHGCKDLQHLAAGIWRRDPSQQVLMSSVSEVSTFQKGLIAPGSDADIVVWNPNKTRSSVLRYFSSCFLF